MIEQQRLSNIILPKYVIQIKKYHSHVYVFLNKSTVHIYLSIFVKIEIIYNYKLYCLPYL